MEAELAAKHESELAALAARLRAPPVDGKPTVSFVPTPHDDKTQQDTEGAQPGTPLTPPPGLGRLGGPAPLPLSLSLCV